MTLIRKNLSYALILIVGWILPSCQITSSSSPSETAAAVSPDLVPAEHPLALATDTSVGTEHASNQLSQPIHSPQLIRKTLSGIQFEGVAFDSRSHVLKVIDQPNGPGSQYPNSQSVISETGAILAINGGFFTPEGNPLGTVISAGKRAGHWNSASSLGTGIYRIDAHGRASISRRKNFSDVAASQELLQAGPLLIENHQVVRGLRNEKTAWRTVLLNDGSHRWWIGRASPCTLAQLGRALAQASPATWPVAYALNLDGGRSSELYISSKLSGGPIERRGLFNRPVRNFLILEAR